MKLQISIVVIFDQFRGEKLERLLSSMKNQLSHYPCEIIFLQESDMPDPSLPPPSFSVPLRHVTIPAKKGIAFNRNQGIRQARGEIIVFIDDDCWVQENWLKSMVEPLLNDRLSNDKKVMAVTSGTKIPQSNFLGDCIAALGFPGGGSLGFEKVWKVDQQGFTNHLAVGNCALRRSIFDKVGWFDEEMRFGAEDAEFSVRLEKAGLPIKYVPEAYAFHEARTTWKSFVQWQLRRGKANYYFKKKVGKVGGFVKLRVWSAKNIFWANKSNWRLPFILFFLGASLVLQQKGYLLERKKYG